MPEWIFGIFFCFTFEEHWSMKGGNGPFLEFWKRIPLKKYVSAWFERKKEKINYIHLTPKLTLQIIDLMEKQQIWTISYKFYHFRRPHQTRNQLNDDASWQITKSCNFRKGHHRPNLVNLLLTLTERTNCWPLSLNCLCLKYMATFFVRSSLLSLRSPRSRRGSFQLAKNAGRWEF